MRAWAFTLFLVLSLPARADFNDGVFAYANGDYEKALQTFLPMAQSSNDPLAQYWLGMMSLKGQGLPEDAKAAADWFVSSAKQGFVNAQFKLAELYRDGQGVPQDHEAAYAWFAASEHLGHKRGAASKADVMAKLSAEELSSAERLADQFIKDYGKPPATINTGQQAPVPTNIQLPPATQPQSP